MTEHNSEEPNLGENTKWRSAQIVSPELIMIFWELKSEQQLTLRQFDQVERCY